MTSAWQTISNVDADAQAEIEWTCPDCAEDTTFLVDAIEMTGTSYVTEECTCGGKVEYVVLLEVRHLAAGEEEE